MVTKFLAINLIVDNYEKIIFAASELHIYQ